LAAMVEDSKFVGSNLGGTSHTHKFLVETADWKFYRPYGS